MPVREIYKYAGYRYMRVHKDWPLEGIQNDTFVTSLIRL